MTVWEFGDILYRFNFGEPYDINLELNTYDFFQPAQESLQ
jgi:hypothetical protein